MLPDVQVRPSVAAIVLNDAWDDGSVLLMGRTALTKGGAPMAQAGHQDWDDATLEAIRQAKAAWADHLGNKSSSKAETTLMIERQLLNTPTDLPAFAYLDTLGMSGAHPLTLRVALSTVPRALPAHTSAKQAPVSCKRPATPSPTPAPMSR